MIKNDKVKYLVTYKDSKGVTKKIRIREEKLEQMKKDKKIEILGVIDEEITK